MVATEDFTQWSTVMPLVKEVPDWLPEEEQERIASYAKYDEMYWSDPRAFRLVRRGTDTDPIFIPNARTVVDSTAHFLMKGLSIGVEDAKKHADIDEALRAILKREKFYSRFHTAKHAGVARGDWVFHMTADPNKEPGHRISLVSVDPGQWIPIYDDEDLDKLEGVKLFEQFTVEDVDSEHFGKDVVRELHYEYAVVEGKRRVVREQRLVELSGWGTRDEKVLAVEIFREALPEPIRTIPVYHFQNMPWQGQPFGSSEIRGLETIVRGISQSISDEDLALALMGLGVYATDGGPPIDEEGNEGDWVIAPASVMQVPAGAYFRMVEGIGTVQPYLDHVGYLEKAMYEAVAHFRAGDVDVQVAESGAALAIKFLPTLAKLEVRDNDGVDTLNNLFFDWRIWHNTFEDGPDLDLDAIVEAHLGDKLPQSRKEVLNELNNMLDRHVISREYYRQKMMELGYKFPDDMDAKIREEVEFFSKFKANVDTGNRSNNADDPNESGGTEADQPLERQAKTPPARGRG